MFGTRESSTFSAFPFAQCLLAGETGAVRELPPPERYCYKLRSNETSLAHPENMHAAMNYDERENISMKAGGSVV